MELSISELSVEICSRLNIPLKGKISGQVLVRCINPNHIDRNPSCSISLDKGVGKCWSCGFSFSLKSFYYQKFGRSIFKDLGIPRSFIITPQIEELADLSQVPETDFKLTGQFLPLGSNDLIKKWIKNRGFNQQHLENLGVKYMRTGRTVKTSDPTNKEEWRYYSDVAFIPIFEGKDLLCFEARQLRTEEEWLKYLKNKNINITEKKYKKVLYPKNSSTKTLYKLNYLDQNEPLYVVEGLMDVISLRTHRLFQNSTCTFGRSIKERQFYLLSKFKKIIVIPNNDQQGILAMQQFKGKNNVFILPLPISIKDVNEILQKKDKRFRSLDDLVQFKWHEKLIPFNEYDIDAHINRLS